MAKYHMNAYCPVFPHQPCSLKPTFAVVEKQSFLTFILLQKSTTLPSAHVFVLVAESLLLPPCLPSNLSSFFHSAPLNGLGHEKAIAYKKIQS